MFVVVCLRVSFDDPAATGDLSHEGSICQRVFSLRFSVMLLNLQVSKYQGASLASKRRRLDETTR